MSIYVQPLPLYDSIRERVFSKAGEGWACPNREKVAAVCSQLDPERSVQLVLLLIHYHFLLNPQTNPFTPESIEIAAKKRGKALPLGIKISSGGKGISIDLNVLPDPLIMLIADFCGL
jgi:hypothetical protein